MSETQVEEQFEETIEDVDAVDAEDTSEEIDVSEPEEDASDDAADTEADDDDDEIVLTIDGVAPDPEEEHTEAPQWVRDLRKQDREKSKKIKELERKLEDFQAATQPKEEPLGEKPTLDDFDYDTDKYEEALVSYYDRKRKHDEQQAKILAEQQEQQQAWESRLGEYQERKQSLGFHDVDDAEDVAKEVFDVTQQGIIIQAADDPALMVYALGKNPKKAKEIASIKDPVKFTAAIAKMETTLKVQKRKAAVKPEKTLGGTGRPFGTVDNTLEKLRAEAEKTGDYSKVFAYRRKSKT